MSKYIKPEVNEDKLGINPFLNSLIVPVNKVKDKGDNKFTQDGDEWYKGEWEYDADSYCKVFSDSARRQRVSSLTPRGKDLLMWLQYEAKKGKDWLWVNKQRYMAECNVSSVTTYRSAVNDLIKNSIIIKTVITDVFWINPYFLFNGSRIKAFPDNVKVK